MDTNLGFGPTFPLLRSNNLLQQTKPDCTSEGRLTVKETYPRHQLEIRHKKDKLEGNMKSITSS